MDYFSLFNTPDFFINVESNFVYNYYDQNECLTPDFDIATSAKSVFKFNKLDIEIRSYYDERINKYLESLNFNYLKSLNGKILSDKELFYFNKLILQNENNKGINLDRLKLEIENLNNFIGLDKDKNYSAKEFLLSNVKLTVNNNYFKDFYNNNLENILFSAKQKKDLVMHNKIFNKNKQVSLNKNEFELNNNFKSYNSKTIYNQKNETFYVNVGVLIEKFTLSENNKIKKLSSIFRYNEVDTQEFDKENLHKFTDTLNDHGVKYGQKYFYVIYPVYHTTIPKKLDYHIMQDFIICDRPYFTDIIECVEKKRPNEPINISFNYVEDKNTLKIKWKKPIEIQGDVKGYQVFKRYSLSDPYVLICQLESHNKKDTSYIRNKNISSNIVKKIKNTSILSFEDDNFNKEKIQIYTICAIDAHGFTSNYASQYAVKFDGVKKSCIIDLISSAGAPLHMPNILIPRKTIFFNNEESIVTNTPAESNVSKYTIYITPEYEKIEKANDSFLKVLNNIESNTYYSLNSLRIEDSQLHKSKIKIKNFINES